ncbi:Predicted arabinose efflux permease, MFS family [Mariniphaga anaerophila]|uniref:Predicted arabinose efflux permease, MFS family n=1 Tax=Mariniphaga anaerophila TaxID=1484053 RepID=A0A1M4SQ62_9BACT|nr:MFS transporter [Mariniphaga anaerophila]SHE34350.1 Predicted arabinose efflux permease, MFS family [Mariniphaga anaerophila]
MMQFRKNIASLYVIKISKWFNLVMPVVVLFYQDNGMGMHEIFILKSIYSLAIVGLELPSGWMADVWGRKKTLLLGAVLGSAGFLMYSFSYGFWAFAVAEIVLGAGHSFVSGADSAMLYESLKADKKSDEYVKHEGRITSAGNFAEALAGIAAGFLAAVSLRSPFYFQFIVAALAVPAALVLKEPVNRSGALSYSVKRMALVIKGTLLKNTNLRVSILLSAVTGTATLTFAWLVQPFFKAINLPVEWFGILWTVLNLSVGVSSAFAFRFEGRISRKNEVLTIILLLALGYFFSGLAVVREGLFFLFLFYLVRGLATPIFKNYINLYTPSEIRATILSVRNLLIRISFAVIGPLLGWMTDQVNLKTAFILAGALYIIAALLAVWPWLSKNQQ